MSGLPLVGARVCFTGLTPDAQDALVGKLRQLGAHFADNLIKGETRGTHERVALAHASVATEVTHLVVGKVGSEKHRKAMAMPDVHLVEVLMCDHFRFYACDSACVFYRLSGHSTASRRTPDSLRARTE